MKKTNRFRWLLAMMLLLALGAAACSGTDDAEDVDGAIEDVVSEAGDVIDAVTSEADDALSEAEDTADDADAPTEGGDAAPAGDLGLATDGAVLVGSDINFAPFESYEDDTEVGFDIDLMDEITTRLGLEVTYENVSFDTIFTQLAAGQYDAIISAITITDERDETIDFSEPYFSANQALSGPEGTEIASVDDLTGELVVAVQSGTTGEAYANENFTDVEVQSFPSSTDAFNAMAADQVDAVFIDIPVVQEQVTSGDATLIEEVATGELYGIGIPEGNTALKDAIDGALAEIIEDGTYEEIFTTWFPDDDVAVALEALG